jgi:hypothetical protein
MLGIQLRGQVIQQTDAGASASLLVVNSLRHQHRHNQQFSLAPGKRFGCDAPTYPNAKIRSMCAYLGTAVHYILFAVGS